MRVFVLFFPFFFPSSFSRKTQRKTLASLPPPAPLTFQKNSYWTIAGVSDEGGITSFDEDFFL